MLTSIASIGLLNATANAQQISESGLQTVILQTAAQSDDPAESPLPDDAELEGSVNNAMMDVAEASDPSSGQPSVMDQPVVNSSPIPTRRPVDTKAKKATALKNMRGAYAGVFYANDFSYLNDPYYDGPRYFSDAFKGMDTCVGTVSVGGETRWRYHNERNFRGPNGLTGADDNFWLSRQRLYADWRINDCFRIYGELLDADSHGNDLPPLPIEENDIDIQNLFADVKLFDGDMGKMTLRVGRQELLYGAQRTVSPLDWANTRRTFEGVRALYQDGDFSFDGFWTKPVVVDANDADEGDENEYFFGFYASLNNTPLDLIETYYLGYTSENTSINPRLNRDFSYHTVGARTIGATDRGMLYEFEGAIQFGDNNTPDSHFAGFFTGGLGRKFETNFLSPTVWMYYDYASGEEDFEERSVGDGGYHHLFPLAHKYNGFMDLFGRRNLHDINTQIITPLGDRVSMLVWYHYFLLDEKTTPYNVVMIPYNQAGTPAEDRELGHEIDVLFNINLNPRNNILLGYSHFSGGDYYDSANIGPADEDNDADFFYAQFQTQY